MKVGRNKCVGVWHVTGRVGAQFGKAAYIRVTEWSLITSGSTAEVRWTMWRLGSLLVERTGVVNHLDLNHIHYVQHVLKLFQ